jgi:hypothetical protein
MAVIQKERTNHKDRSKVLEEQVVEEYPPFGVDKQRGCDVQLRWLGLCDSRFFNFPWPTQVSPDVSAAAVAQKCASDTIFNKAGCQYH